jgi:uncharacterized protein
MSDGRNDQQIVTKLLSEMTPNCILATSEQGFRVDSRTMSYMPRVVDAELVSRLGSAGIVVIEGPKACGKTETALRVAMSSARLDIDPAARRAAQIDPGLILDGETPRLIDEWQVEPDVWNHARHAVDRRQQSGQFIFTGSAVPDDDVNRHTGTGRFSFLRMRPMSLFESGLGTGSVSLASLLSGVAPRSTEAAMTVPDLAHVLVRGGWPAQQLTSIGNAALAAKDYLQQVRDVDVNRVGATRRDPIKVRRLLVALARNVSTEVSLSTLAADAGGPDGEPARNTVTDYLDVLSRLMVIEDQPAWAPHLRSKTPLRQAAKRHFVDPSLAVAALGAGPDRLRRDLELLGLLFESLVIRDLRILSQPLGGTVFHYRDKDGLEVDAIVQLDDGRWGAFEVKLGGDKLIDAGAASLRRFAKVVDTARTGTPACPATATSAPTVSP